MSDPPMSLEPGDDFSLTLRVTVDALLLLLRRNQEDLTYSIPLGSASGIDLTIAHYVTADSSVTLNYVNVVSGCPWQA